MNKSIALDIQNVSKQYRLGKVGTGTLSHDLNRWWASIRGKEDPYLKIGETNDRTKKGSSEYVWALKDVDFQIEQGDAVGIIGRNGAGKSTLLKLLSRVTKPTTGSIKYKGRIASLLEVGTGFHPEMTGRENIYLNGAILGMTKKEIARKFDEIVDFSGVERYIDTPVKRYSSGMYVRLAFAVAAHLESEILIVDEVLAVGDAEFQKKCLGKMGDVSKGEGRTVLFVSHNMGSIKALCSKGLFMETGTVKYAGDIDSSIQLYMESNAGDAILKTSSIFNDLPEKPMVINHVQLLKNGQPTDSPLLDFHDKIGFEITLSIKEKVANRGIVIYCKDQFDTIMLNFDISTLENLILHRDSGVYKIRVEYPVPFLKQGTYTFDFEIGHFGSTPDQYERNGIGIDIDILSKHIRYQAADKKRPGIFNIEPTWQYLKANL
ncbi:ABC transporter ATP-binding protein [Sphingobacterium wenxiniae]|uniref:Lipopolysaccharide transport system ATP-binding protein n=1 Tax=Sphingobacterium wenxiniae TaxID=683125 RepID=A0A1I6U7M5_9SPHI|nr:ABC transporter ATP-binding protein [Sphingobacterium wenxiniae]SFS97456.1 lipopolysaccharide transport system ATP-binding protein [Sphingobacterium wenxiniae]